MDRRTFVTGLAASVAIPNVGVALPTSAEKYLCNHFPTAEIEVQGERIRTLTAGQWDTIIAGIKQALKGPPETDELFYADYGLMFGDMEVAWNYLGGEDPILLVGEVGYEKE